MATDMVEIPEEDKEILRKIYGAVRTASHSTMNIDIKSTKAQTIANKVGRDLSAIIQYITNEMATEKNE